MALYQYVWREYTRRSLIEWEEKVKVVEWEIVESDRDEKNFTSIWFKKVEEEEVEKTLVEEEEVEKKAKKSK